MVLRNTKPRSLILTPLLEETEKALSMTSSEQKQSRSYIGSTETFRQTCLVDQRSACCLAEIRLSENKHFMTCEDCEKPCDETSVHLE